MPKRKFDSGWKCFHFSNYYGLLLLLLLNDISITIQDLCPLGRFNGLLTNFHVIRKTFTFFFPFDLISETAKLCSHSLVNTTFCRFMFTIFKCHIWMFRFCFFFHSKSRFSNFSFGRLTFSKRFPCSLCGP